MATPIFTIEPNPHWVIIDNFSKLPNGAAIYTYRSLDPSVFKPAFQDSAGNIPYGQPIVGFGNGTMPPIFWEFDPDNPTDTYYIRVYDSADPNTQQFLWDFNGLSGGGSGGGGTVVTAFDIENLVINGVFYRNIGNQPGTPSLPTLLTIAPGANAGFVGDTANLGGSPAPDIIFAKNNNSSSDSLSFPTVPPAIPIGTHYLPGQDISPQQYLKYACTGAGAAETYKYIQFPISQGVQNLSSQPVTVKIFARCNSGDPTLTLTWRQFYGNGGAPSVDQLIPVTGPITLTSSWAVYTFNSLVPDAAGKTLGTCGNDGLFLQVGYPLSPSLTDIDFVKPAIYLGSIAPGIDYHTNDMIDSVMDTARTGDIRMSLNAFLMGWIAMDDGTIGDSSSGATRPNIDTFPLFSLIWNTFTGSQTLAPMFTSGGVPVAYGASAIIDFNANRRLSLTKAAGRVMAGISGSHLIGENGGADTHTLISSELPNPITTTTTSIVVAAGGANTVIANDGPGGAGIIANTGGNTAFDIRQPTVYMNVFIKL